MATIAKFAQRLVWPEKGKTHGQRIRANKNAVKAITKHKKNQDHVAFINASQASQTSIASSPDVPVSDVEDQQHDKSVSYPCTTSGRRVRGRFDKGKGSDFHYE